MLLHPTFVMLGYAKCNNSTFLKQASNLIGMGPTMIGFVAAGVVAVAAGSPCGSPGGAVSYETGTPCTSCSTWRSCWR